MTTATESIAWFAGASMTGAPNGAPGVPIAAWIPAAACQMTTVSPTVGGGDLGGVERRVAHDLCGDGGAQHERQAGREAYGECGGGSSHSS